MIVSPREMTTILRLDPGQRISSAASHISFVTAATQRKRKLSRAPVTGNMTDFGPLSRRRNHATIPPRIGQRTNNNAQQLPRTVDPWICN